MYDVQLPVGLPDDQIVFSASYLFPRGYLLEARQVIFFDPREYYSLATAADRSALSWAISRLNENLPEKEFVFVGSRQRGALIRIWVFLSVMRIFKKQGHSLSFQGR